MQFAFIENIFIIICFTIIAVYFDRWWVVLLAFLLMNSVKGSEK